MKLYDFDGIFDEKLSEYISKNSGKYSESEWEDIIPVLYKKFGDTVLKSIGKTPRAFYKELSDEELVKCLKAHLKQGVPVSDFLCTAIEERNICALLLPLLDGTRSECEYALSLIGSDVRAVKKLMQMLITVDDEDIKNTCVDYIKENADSVLEEAVKNFKNGVCPQYMLEIMSRATKKSDEIFDILIKSFRTDPENIPMHASYLAAYGDERAIGYITDKIEEEGITFVEFQELKYAIEALGGEYKKERDFSGDPYYKLIHPNG